MDAPARPTGKFSHFRLAAPNLRHRTLVVLFVGFAASAIAPPPRLRAAPGGDGDASPRSAVDAEFLKINSLFNQELYALAAPRYEKLLADHPSFDRASTVHYALAVCHHSLAADAAAKGEEDERRAHLEKAVEFGRLAIKDKDLGTRKEALELLASDFFQIGDHENAAKVYRALHKRTEGAEQVDAALGLADCLYETKQYAEAKTFYEEALATLDRSPPADAAASERRDRARFHLALTLYRGGEPTASLPYFSALASTPAGEEASKYRGDALYMTALVQQAAKNDDAALAAFQALSASTETPELRASGLYGTGSLLFQKGDFQGAAKALAELRQEFPESEHREYGDLYLGRALIETGDVARGTKLLDGLRASDAVGIDAGLALSRAQTDRGAHDEALATLDAALARFGERPEAEPLRLERAIGLISLRRYDDALTAVEEFERAHPNSAAADRAAYLGAYALHHAASEGGRHAAAFARCRAFLEKHKDSEYADEVRQLAAESLFLAGKYEEATVLYSKNLAELESAGDASADAVATARIRLAEASFYAGHYDAAQRFLDDLAPTAAARSADALFATYDYLRGEVAYQRREYQAAATAFRRHLERASPKHASDARFKLAHALQLAGDGAAARGAYAAALDADRDTPHASQIRFELGQIAMEAKDFPAATKAFEAVVETDPASRFAPHAYHFLGWIAQEEGRHADATKWFTLLTTKHPDHELHAEGLYFLALGLQAQQRFDEARQVLESLEKSHPGADIATKVKLQEGVSLARAGRSDDALAVLEPLRDGNLEPSLEFLLHYELAWCYRGAERPADAIASYEAIIARAARGDAEDPEGLASVARLELAELRFEAGEFSASRELLEPLLASGDGVSADPGLREKALYRAAWCDYKAGDAKRLAATHVAMARGFPKGELIHEVALLAARQNVADEKYKEAAEAFISIVRAVPTPPEAELALVSYAECMSELGRHEDALETADAFIGKYGESAWLPRARFTRGWSCENLRKFDDAIESYRAVTGGTELAARAQFQVGQCLAAEKRYDDAIVEFLQVPTRFGFDEWSSRATLQIAGCFEELGDTEKARKFYRQVTTKYADRKEARLAEERLRQIQ